MLARTSRSEISHSRNSARTWGERKDQIGISLEDHHGGAEIALVERDDELVPVERVAAHVPVLAEGALDTPILVEAALVDGRAAHVAQLQPGIAVRITIVSSGAGSREGQRLQSHSTAPNVSLARSKS